MMLRKILKLLIPPLFFSIFKRQAWVLYSTLDHALQEIKNKGYRDPDLVEHIQKKTRSYIQNLHGCPNYDFTTIGTMLPIFLASNNQSVNVIDFGGGAGVHYFIFRQLCGNRLNVRWHVIETSEMCKQASSLQDGSLFFHDNLVNDSINTDSIDIVYSNSALQYHPAPLAMLTELINLNARYFFLTRTPLNANNRDVFSVQKTNLHANGPGISNTGIDKEVAYPLTFISRSAVENALEKRYRTIFQTKEGLGVFDCPSEKISMDGYFCIRK